MVNANVIRRVAVDNLLTNTKIIVIDSINEIEDIISEATKGKFGIFIKNSSLNFQQIIPELEANSYLVDNYIDYIGIYWQLQELIALVVYVGRTLVFKTRRRGSSPLQRAILIKFIYYVVNYILFNSYCCIYYNTVN